jgi:hypothetical protein
LQPKRLSKKFELIQNSNALRFGAKGKTNLREALRFGAKDKTSLREALRFGAKDKTSLREALRFGAKDKTNRKMLPPNSLLKPSREARGKKLISDIIIF